MSTIVDDNAFTSATERRTSSTRFAVGTFIQAEDKRTSTQELLRRPRLFPEDTERRGNNGLEQADDS